jgi:type II secretory pathway pseudopilin PulG
MHYKIRFRVSIVVAISLIIVALTAATIGNVWLVSSNTAEKTAANLFQSITQSAYERLARLVGETQVLVNFGTQQSNIKDPTNKGLNWSLFFGALEDYP